MDCRCVCGCTAPAVFLRANDADAEEGAAPIDTLLLLLLLLLLLAGSESCIAQPALGPYRSKKKR